MGVSTQDTDTLDLSSADCVYCPRCDGTSVRPLPRVSVAHAAWCECSTCGYVWMAHMDPKTEHRQLYGRL
jgi:hypothetical protein